MRWLDVRGVGSVFRDVLVDSSRSAGGAVKVLEGKRRTAWLNEKVVEAVKKKVCALIESEL